MQRIQKIQQKKTTRNRILKVLFTFIILATIAVALLELTNKTHLLGDKPRNASPEQPAPSTDDPQSPQTGDKQEPQPQPDPKYPSSEPASYTTLAENEQYAIKKVKDSETYLVTLYAIINRPDQYEMYQQQLKEYKINALNHLQSKGVNTGEVTIEYEPEEAASL